MCVIKHQSRNVQQAKQSWRMFQQTVSSPHHFFSNNSVECCFFSLDSVQMPCMWCRSTPLLISSSRLRRLHHCCLMLCLKAFSCDLLPSVWDEASVSPSFSISQKTLSHRARWTAETGRCCWVKWTLSSLQDLKRNGTDAFLKKDFFGCDRKCLGCVDCSLTVVQTAPPGGGERRSVNSRTLTKPAVSSFPASTGADFVLNVNFADRESFLYVCDVHFKLSSMRKGTFGEFGPRRLRT